MKTPEGDTVHKLSSANAQLLALLERAGVTKEAIGDMAPGGMGGGDVGAPPAAGPEAAKGPEQLLQDLLAKQAAGTLSEEEAAILEQLLAGGAAGGGAAPPMGGGEMVREASEQRVNNVANFLRARLLG